MNPNFWNELPVGLLALAALTVGAYAGVFFIILPILDGWLRKRYYKGSPNDQP